jgi:hypothetical protein
MKHTELLNEDGEKYCASVERVQRKETCYTLINSPVINLKAVRLVLRTPQTTTNTVLSVDQWASCPTEAPNNNCKDVNGGQSRKGPFGRTHCRNL